LSRTVVAISASTPASECGHFVLSRTCSPTIICRSSARRQIAAGGFCSRRITHENDPCCLGPNGCRNGQFASASRRAAHRQLRRHSGCRRMRPRYASGPVWRMSQKLCQSSRARVSARLPYWPRRPMPGQRALVTKRRYSRNRGRPPGAAFFLSSRIATAECSFMASLIPRMAC
jgi:hypothetical protein